MGFVCIFSKGSPTLTLNMQLRAKVIFGVAIIVSISSITLLVSFNDRSNGIFKQFVTDLENQTHQYPTKPTNSILRDQYTEQFGRSPPSGFDNWISYATRHQCSLNLSDYAGIFRDLKPFANGITEKDLLDLRYSAVYHEVEIRDGAYYNGPHSAYKRFFLRYVN